MPYLSYCVIPPNWPVVSHDSGLFHGTEETGCPFASTSLAEGVVAELEQPTWNKTKGRRKRIERRRVICLNKHVIRLVKHLIADLNIAFYIRQNFRHRVVGIDLGDP